MAARLRDIDRNLRYLSAGTGLAVSPPPPLIIGRAGAAALGLKEGDLVLGRPVAFPMDWPEENG